MKKVNFTEMKNGTKEDYQLLEKYEKNFERETSDRILKYLSSQTTTLEGYQITRLEHSLQSATRAFENGESEEMVVATLLHDIGDDFSANESLTICCFNSKTLCFRKNSLDNSTPWSFSNLLQCSSFRR